MCRVCQRACGSRPITAKVFGLCGPAGAVHCVIGCPQSWGMRCRVTCQELMRLMFLVHMLCNTYVFSLSCLQTATPPHMRSCAMRYRVMNPSMPVLFRLAILLHIVSTDPSILILTSHPSMLRLPVFSLAQARTSQAPFEAVDGWVRLLPTSSRCHLYPERRLVVVRRPCRQCPPQWGPAPSMRPA